jgi:hypothetical protein
MLRAKALLPLLAVAGLGILGQPAAAVVLGQVDDFEDGTTQNWEAGVPHPAPPENTPTGGPAGADDNYLLLTALGGQVAGSRLSAFNRLQWIGDYISAGVGGIDLDLNNLSSTDLSIRLYITDQTLGIPTNSVVTEAVQLPAGSGWQSVGFSLDPADLVVLHGDATQALTHAVEVRIFHNVDPSYPPGPVVAQLGIDNIVAAPTNTPVEGTSWGQVKGLYR